MLQLFIVILLSVSAFAKDFCVVLLENQAGGKFQDNPDTVVLAQAQQWLADYGHAKSSNEESVSFYRHWQKWNTVNEQQRDHTLALELKLISPPADGNLFLWNGRDKLNKLSKTNLKRMLLQLKIRHPETADSTFDPSAEAISQSVRLSYSIPHPARPLNGVTPPLPSPRELLKNGLHLSGEDYYSTLLNGSPSSAFSVKLNTGSARGPAIYLRDDVAQAQGFVVPHFDNVESLIAFFEIWDIQALDEVVRANRMSFPFTVKTGRQMLDYFQTNAIDIDQIFPPQAPEKLSVLREKLKDYILTDEDARTFIREAFYLYTIVLARTQPTSCAHLASALRDKKKMASGDRLFRKFFEFIEIPGLDLRMPVAASASDYTIEPEASAEYGFRPPLSGLNSFQRRVDHNSQP
jgi:hypothetical protein